MVLHEEETEITEIEDTSITDLIADSSQGFPNLSSSSVRIFHRMATEFQVTSKSLLSRQGNIHINMRLPSYDSVVNKSDGLKRENSIEETKC